MAGKLYSQDATGQWYEYSGSQFLAWVDPALEFELVAGRHAGKSGQRRRSGDQRWRLDVRHRKNQRRHLYSAKWESGRYAAAVGLKVANGGSLYSFNAQGQWFQWTGTKWSAIANPNPLVTTLVSDTGSSSTDGITSNPAIKGTGEANTLVTIKEGGTVSARRWPTAREPGALRRPALADGAHTLTATQTDLAGNTGTATLSFTLDTTAAGA